MLTFEDVIDVTCFDSNDGSIEVSFSGGSGTLNYRWQKMVFYMLINKQILILYHPVLILSGLKTQMDVYLKL